MALPIFLKQVSKSSIGITQSIHIEHVIPMMIDIFGLIILFSNVTAECDTRKFCDSTERGEFVSNIRYPHCNILLQFFF